MPKSITVTLGEREYVIAEAKTRQNAAWRAKFAEPFADLSAVMGGDLNSAVTMQQLVTLISGKVVQSVDIIKGLLYDYAPALAADKERIESECYDSEIVAAFVEVLKLAYPFGSLIQKIATAVSKGGLENKPTQQS
jgi:hypothetical protein